MAVTDAETDAGAERDADAETDAGAETDADAERDADTETDAGAERDADAETDAGTKLDAAPAAELVVDPLLDFLAETGHPDRCGAWRHNPLAYVPR